MSKRTRIHPVQFYLNDDEQYILCIKINIFNIINCFHTVSLFQQFFVGEVSGSPPHKQHIKHYQDGTQSQKKPRIDQKDASKLSNNQCEDWENQKYSPLLCFFDGLSLCRTTHCHSNRIKFSVSPPTIFR